MRYIAGSLGGVFVFKGKMSVCCLLQFASHTIPYFEKG